MRRRGRGRPGAVSATLGGAVLIAALVSATAGQPQAARAADDGAAWIAARAAAPEPASRGEIAGALAAVIAGDMNVPERAAAVVMGHVGGTDPNTLARYVAGGGLGGFILMGSNVPRDPEALARLTEAIAGAEGDLPPLLAVDQEGGVVSRLAGDDAPAGAELSRRPPEAARAAFGDRGALLEAAGISTNFGIVADVGTATSGFIRPRTLGGDAAAAAERVAAAVEGERSHAFSTLKHFPGHGAAAGDSHSIIPETGMTLATWRREHAPPFAAGIDAGAELVMTGHLRFTAVDDVPASVSPEWYRILREELGFEGVAITDDLGMLLASGDERYADPATSAVDAVAAGADMVLMVAGSDADTATDMAHGIAAAVDRGDIPGARLRAAATRVVTLRVLASGLLDDAIFDPAG